MEAPPGIEPGMEVLQTSALPLGDGASGQTGKGTLVSDDLEAHLCHVSDQPRRPLRVAAGMHDGPGD